MAEAHYIFMPAMKHRAAIRPLLAFTLVLTALSLPHRAAAQKKQGQARLDSLLAEAPKMAEDTAAVRLMTYISAMYQNINPDEGLKWAARELALAQKLGWRAGEGFAYNDFGNNYNNKGAYPEALEAYFKCLRIAEEQGNGERAGSVSGNIGNVYARQKDYAKALEWHFKSLKAAEGRGDKTRMQAALGNIGSVYQAQGKYSDALEYKKKALAIAEALNDKGGIIIQTGNIGANYADGFKQYNEALPYYFKALRIAEETGDKTSIAINLGNAGEAYYQIAKDSAAPKPDSLVPASRAANLAKAVAYLNRSIAACRKAQLLEGIPEFSQYLSDALALQGDYKGAMAAYKQSVAMQDSLHNTANNAAITNLETKRAVELKDKDIQIAKLAVAKKRNERGLFMAVIGLMMGVMGLLFGNYKKQQRSAKIVAKGKKLSDDLLLNILPAEVAEELKEKGEAHARQYDAVSVLFTDFVDFTGTAQQLSPQALVRELHECFTAFDAIIERNGLEKIKTIGDAYMAVCGLPAADPCHAQRTVQAALEIRDFIAERKKRERVFEIRIGIHSGPVVAGIVGVKKFAYDIWGDTVNTAARMEQHSEPGAVNISQATYELVKEDYRCNYRGQIAAKNKGEVAMYFVEASVMQTA